MLQKMDYLLKGVGVKIKKAYVYIWNKNEIKETKTVPNVIIVLMVREIELKIVFYVLYISF